MSNSELRDKVMALEPYPEDLRNQIREQIARTREQPLDVRKQLFLIVSCVVLGMILIGVGVWVAMEFHAIVDKAPGYMLVALAVSVVLSCGLLVSLLLSLKRRAVRPHNGRFMVYAASGIVLSMFVAAMITNKPVTGVDLGAMLIAGVCVVCSCVEAAELRLREHMLRNELALANLAELVTGRTTVDAK